MQRNSSIAVAAIKHASLTTVAYVIDISTDARLHVVVISEICILSVFALVSFSSHYLTRSSLSISVVVSQIITKFGECVG